MTYKVIKDFTDLEDNRKLYRVGDTYPRADKTVNNSRLEQLLDGAKNSHGVAFIEEVKETKTAKKSTKKTPAKK